MSIIILVWKLNKQAVNFIRNVVFTSDFCQEYRFKLTTGDFVIVVVFLLAENVEYLNRQCGIPMQLILLQKKQI